MANDDSEPQLVGKVEAQLELLTEVEAAAEPAGLGRKEPQPLQFPKCVPLLISSEVPLAVYFYLNGK